MAKAFLLLNLSLLLLTSFTVYADNQDLVSWVAKPPQHHGGYHAVTPAKAPSPHHHHHHHPYHHPNSPSPSPLAHPPTAHAPSHHHHAHPPAAHAPSHAPVHPPTAHAPSHAPVHPPHLPPTLPPKFHFPRSFVAVQGVVYCKSCKYAGIDTLLGASPLAGAVVKLQCNNTKYPQTVEGKTDKNGYFFLQAPKTVTNYGAHKCKASLVSSPLANCTKPSTLHGGDIGAGLKPEKPFKADKLPFTLFSTGPFAFEPKCH